jgi:Dna[CI] antecedent DciA-like protein
MRGKRRTIASVLAESLAARGAGEPAAIAVAFAEACGPRLAREASCRGVTRDGRLLIVVRTAAWASQVEAVAETLCARVNARIGRDAARGLDVHVGPER